MYIYCKSNNKDISSVMNSCAKSIYKKLDGAYSFKKLNNSSEVRSTILYQIPTDISDKYNLIKEERDKINVMDITIDFTNYSNKLRVNVIEITPEEKTLGHKSFPASTFENIQQGIQLVYEYICNSIKKEFQDYEIIF